MANHHASQKATASWVDAVAVDATLSGVKVQIRNEDEAEKLQVFFGGASMPTKTWDGNFLAPYDSTEGTNTHIWIRGNGIVSFVENDP